MHDFKLSSRYIYEYYIPQVVFEVSLAYGVSPRMHVITTQVDQGPLIPMIPKSALDMVYQESVIPAEFNNSYRESTAIQNVTRYVKIR